MSQQTPFGPPERINVERKKTPPDQIVLLNGWAPSENHLIRPAKMPATLPLRLTVYDVETGKTSTEVMQAAARKFAIQFYNIPRPDDVDVRSRMIGEDTIEVYIKGANDD